MVTENAAAANWTPFVITYKVGRRTLTVERFAPDASFAATQAADVLSAEYFKPVTVLNVEAIDGFYPR